MPIETPHTKHTNVAIWLFLSLLTFHLAITRGHFVSSDEVNLYQITQSLWERGSLAINPILATFPGRDGLYYSQYSVGQALAAVPLYAVGSRVGEWLSANGHTDWLQALAGPVIAIPNNPSKWGGEIEIFFVNLFNCFTTAMLCTVFFLLCYRLGASLRNAALTALLVGTLSYMAPYSVGFFRHTSEALFVLSAFYFLVCERQQARASTRALAGLMLALALLFRQPAALTWPVLSAYMAWLIWQRHRPVGWRGMIGALLRDGWPFAVPMLLGLIIHVAIVYWKFETFPGPYMVWGGDQMFGTPLLVGLYGFLFSPGASLFLFTPLLVLLPWTLSHGLKKNRTEAVVLIGLTISYLLVYSKLTDWHGLYAYGPRYLGPLMVLLMLPLAAWFDSQTRQQWWYLTPLLLLSFWMQLTHIAVNFSYTLLVVGYDTFRPPFGFMFIPDQAPVVFMSKALLSGDHRVDMWLLNLYRQFGFDYLWGPLLVFTAMLVFCCWRLYRNLYAK